MGTALSLLLLTATVGSLVLQLRTVVRVGTAGLAPATWFGLVASALVWLGYGVATRDPTVVLANVAVLLVAVVLAIAVLRATSVPAVRLVPYVAGPVLLWCAAWVADAGWLLGVAGTAVTLGRVVPQLVRALTAPDRSGISVGAWLGNALTNVVWAAYGVTIADVLVWLPSVVSVCLSLAVVGLAHGRGRRPRRPRPSLTAWRVRSARRVGA